MVQLNNTYDTILNDSYQNFLSKTIIPLNRDEFVHKIKTDREFSKKWKTKIIEREANYVERYDYWFANNYETGMERFYENIPDFDDEYYLPTPKNILEIKYGKIIGIKFF